MKVEELRVGNYVFNTAINDTNQNIEHQVREKDLSSQSCYWFNPVPLTEEWLVKLGFIKGEGLISGCEFWECKRYIIARKLKPSKGESFSLWVIGISPPTWVISNFKHLHQLQNLYFALTGEELKLKH